MLKTSATKSPTEAPNTSGTCAALCAIFPLTATHFRTGEEASMLLPGNREPEEHDDRGDVRYQYFTLASFENVFSYYYFVQYHVGNQFLSTNKAGRGDQHA